MKPFTRIASIIFGIIAIVHILRLVLGIRIMLDSIEVSRWVSVVGFIAGLIMCLGLWKEGKH